MTSQEVLTLADQYISGATGGQLFVLRLGITLIPFIALVAAWLILEKKYKIDEKEYERICSELKK